MLFVPAWPFSSHSANPAAQTAGDDDEREVLTLSQRLELYKAHGERPPSSRIDPKLEQRAHSAPLSLVNVWKYGAFLATKATDVASDLVRHQLVGARKKSWGIEMTILSALMRNIGQHSSLADLRMLRTLLAVGTALTPVVPGDALVTPVTFRARRRQLRGFLADADQAEDGKRVIAGEWVVCRNLWLRLQDQWRRARKAEKNGTNLADAGTGPTRNPAHSRVVLYLHGGAYYMFSPATHRTITIPLSMHTESRVFAVDYRLAPETRFPGQLHDAVLAYLRLIEDLHIPPENLVVCGDSAGGGLTMALLLYLRDNAYPLPSACILMSPWVDLTLSCDSWDSNAQFDLVPMPQSGDHLNPILCLLGPKGLSQQYLTHPYVSPLFGQMHGLPPILIQSGDAEVLRDEAMLLAHKATLAGVKVRHEIYEDQIHVFQAFFFLEPAKKALVGCRDFLVGLADDAQRSKARRNVSGVHVSTNPTMEQNLPTEKEYTTTNVNSEENIEETSTSTIPRSMTKEVEAQLDQEIAGDGSGVMLVRGDGTVLDDDLAASGVDLHMGGEGSSGEVTPAAKRTSSSISLRSISTILSVSTPRGRPKLHTDDGATVDRAHEQNENEDPDSPISFKPRRRSPVSADSTDVNDEPPTSTWPTSKTPAAFPSAQRGNGSYFSPSPNTTSTWPGQEAARENRPSGHRTSSSQSVASLQPSTPMRNKTMSHSNLTQNSASSNARYTRGRAHMHLGLTSANAPSAYASTFSSSSFSTVSHGHTPTATTPLLSPSIPSIRKRERATSHPDIFRLCQSWQELGPANDLVVIEATSHTEDPA